MSNDDIDANLVDVLPNNQQINAKNLLRLLRSQGSNLVLWKSNGDISIHGQILPSTNIADFVSDIGRSIPSKIRSPQPALIIGTVTSSQTCLVSIITM